jgi:aminoglycoside phosphotransferase (APT) family kinase protein
VQRTGYFDEGQSDYAVDHRPDKPRQGQAFRGFAANRLLAHLRSICYLKAQPCAIGLKGREYMVVQAEEERADILQKLTAFMSPRIKADGKAIIELIARSGEGDSQQNWSFDAYSAQAPQERLQLLLRRNGPSAASESNRETEFKILKILHEAGLPVPEPYWLDADGSQFGRPSFIMERCRGQADLNLLLEHNALGLDLPTRLQLAQKLTDLMVQIHSLDWRALGVGEILKVPEVSAAQTRLDSIVAEIERWQTEPWPELIEVIEWLRSTMPPARELVLTHGEFRSVQALVDNDGTLVTMLDWEFARISDPLDELAYYYNPTAFYFHTIPGVWEEEDFLTYYERKSGMRVDRRELHWWKTLNMLWVMGFVMQSIVQILSERTDAIRTGKFNARLIAMLQGLLDRGRSLEA